MLGFADLDALGFVHTLLGLAALSLGAAVLLRRKGTRAHRLLGCTYVATMLLMNSTALMIYDLTGRFGLFHVAALVSLATTIGGFLPAYLHRPARDWMLVHAKLMCWSWIGLFAAFLSEIATHAPGIGFGYGVVGAATAAVVIGGAVLIRTRVPRLVATLREDRGRAVE